MSGNKPCKLCGTPTPTVFNIKLKAVHICEGCATSVFIQQAQWYSQQDYSHLYDKLQLSPEEKAVYDYTGQQGDGVWKIYRADKPSEEPVTKFTFIKTFKGKAIYEATGDVPKITIKIVESLIAKGLIRQYSTSTNQHGTYTFYKRY